MTIPEHESGLSHPARGFMLLLPMAVTATVVWLLWPEPVASATGVEIGIVGAIDVVSSAPLVVSLEELVDARDLILAGTITAADPGNGITTNLYNMAIEMTVMGSSDEPIVIENETALVDGAPITTNGVGPPQVGLRMLLFLVAGGTEEFPYYAIVSEQGN